MRSQIGISVAILSLVACATAGSPGAPGAQPPTSAAAATRAELLPKVTRFVEQVAALEPGQLNGGLPDVPATERGLVPGWNDSVCGEVSGAAAQETEYLLRRISDVAREAGATVGGAHCSPDLHIVFTAQPQELVRGWEQTQFADTFGRRALPTVIDQFIATPRPVRVWYNIGVGGPPTPFKYAFTSVWVVVDQARLAGATRQQLADYIALVGLAEIRVGAHIGNAPTILRLFAGAPPAAPPGLSAWDTAFLKAVYSTASWPERWSTRRLNELASNMVHAMVP